jgi:hypothetical protein
MQLQRLGEEQVHPFRSERLYRENGSWYFDTREGTAPGPYEDQAMAKQALAVFLAQACDALPPDQRSSVSEIVGLQDDIQYLVEELLGFFQSRRESGDLAAFAWANNRIAELRRDWEMQWQKERIDVLRYAMESLEAGRGGQ